MTTEPNNALLAELGQIGHDLGKIENRRQIADLAQRLQTVSVGVGRARTIAVRAEGNIPLLRSADCAKRATRITSHKTRSIRSRER